MQISHEEITPAVEVITVSGKVRMGEESEQIVHLVEQLLRNGKRTIVFDVSGVTAIDSTGIGRFICSYNKIAAAGGQMRVAGAPSHLAQTFHVALLDTVFQLYPTLEEACKA